MLERAWGHPEGDEPAGMTARRAAAVARTVEAGRAAGRGAGAGRCGGAGHRNQASGEATAARPPLTRDVDFGVRGAGVVRVRLGTVGSVAYVFPSGTRFQRDRSSTCVVRCTGTGGHVTPGLRDRLVGALVGTALGDAVGAPFEGESRPSPARLEELLDADSPLRWTDDTHMALALTRSLSDNRGAVDPQHLGDTFARAYRLQPWRGYGSGPPQVFAMAERGTAYYDAAAALFGGQGSFGNGAAMRSAPVAIAACPILDHVAALAVAQARVTHAHDDGIDGAVLLACAVSLAAHPDHGWPDDLAAIMPLLRTEGMRERTRTLADVAGDAGALRQLAGEFGSTLAAVDSVPAAVAVFLAHRDDPYGFLRTAVGLGGDTDTVAAMAGALVGATVGIEGLPGRLLDRLEARDEIEQAARRLVGVRG